MGVCTLILPSVFNEKRLQIIQKNTERLNQLNENIRFVKQKRRWIEDRLPTIVSAQLWADSYMEVEELLLKEIQMEQEYRALWTSVACESVPKDNGSQACDVIKLL